MPHTWCFAQFHDYNLLGFSKKMEHWPKVPLSEEKLKGLVDFCKDWTVFFNLFQSNGFCMRTATDKFNSDVCQFCPFALLPTPFPQQCFDKAVHVQKDMNALYFVVAHDHDFMTKSLADVIKTDKFTRKQVVIYNQVMSEGLAQPLVIQIQRSDYMCHAPDNCDMSKAVIKQIEVNNIASSFGALASRCSTLHATVAQRLNVADHIIQRRITQNCALTTVADGLAQAWWAYRNPSATVLFVVEEANQNIVDQRLIEYTLYNLTEHQANVLRLTLAECESRLHLDETSRLLTDRQSGAEIGVVYFRAGYVPDHYKSEREWDARLRIERSQAIKCPWIGLQLANTKKIQQVEFSREIVRVLSEPNLVEHYLSTVYKSDADVQQHSKAVRETFAGLWGLSASEASTKEIVERAMAKPELFVLKPQLEGGGSNIYGKQIVDQLKKMTADERAAYILMEKIEPLRQKNYLLRSNAANANQLPQLQDVVGELGVYGYLLGDVTQAWIRRNVVSVFLRDDSFLWAVMGDFHNGRKEFSLRLGGSQVKGCMIPGGWTNNCSLWLRIWAVKKRTSLIAAASNCMDKHQLQSFEFGSYAPRNDNNKNHSQRVTTTSSANKPNNSRYVPYTKRSESDRRQSKLCQMEQKFNVLSNLDVTSTPTGTRFGTHKQPFLSRAATGPTAVPPPIQSSKVLIQQQQMASYHSSCSNKDADAACSSSTSTTVSTAQSMSVSVSNTTTSTANNNGVSVASEKVTVVDLTEEKEDGELDESIQVIVQRSSVQNHGGIAKTASEPLISDLKSYQPLDIRDNITQRFGTKNAAFRRLWIPSRLSPPKPPDVKPFHLTLCSYNVLSQATVPDTMYLYRHLQNQNQLLSWQHRWSRLSAEFDLLNADVYCLQEVQAEHYDDYYLPFFSAQGYGGTFLKRSGEKRDGCATFWRTSKFTLAEERNVPYFMGNNQLLDRDNVGLIVSLQPVNAKTESKRLLVANTHLLFNPKRGDVKLAQLALLFAKIHEMRGQNTPLILAGDFNFEPLCPLYQFVIEGKISYRDKYPHELSGQGELSRLPMPNTLLPPHLGINTMCEFTNTKTTSSSSQGRIDPTPGFLAHNLNMISVYRHLNDPNSKNYECSGYHSRGAHMVDYIFYGVDSKTVNRRGPYHLAVNNIRESSLRCAARLSLPSAEQIRKSCGPLPNRTCGSDHIPLLAKFEWDL